MKMLEEVERRRALRQQQNSDCSNVQLLRSSLSRTSKASAHTRADTLSREDSVKKTPQAITPNAGPISSERTKAGIKDVFSSPASQPTLHASGTCLQNTMSEHLAVCSRSECGSQEAVVLGRHVGTDDNANGNVTRVNQSAPTTISANMTSGCQNMELATTGDSLCLGGCAQGSQSTALSFQETCLDQPLSIGTKGAATTKGSAGCMPALSLRMAPAFSEQSVRRGAVLGYYGREEVQTLASITKNPSRIAAYNRIIESREAARGDSEVGMGRVCHSGCFAPQ